MNDSESRECISEQSILAQLGITNEPTNCCDMELYDQKRAKKLIVRITYPVAGQHCPVIVFSHGAGGARDGYEFLAQYWAAHGYVCIQPSHADSIALNREQGNRLSFSKTIRALPNDKPGWVARAHDISFILDSLSEMNTAPSQLKGKLALGCIAVGGHSYGAFTAQILAGAKMPSVADDVADDASVMDARVRCILAISPQGVRPGPVALGFESALSFNALKVPALFLTGDRDESTWNSSTQRQDAFKYCPGGNKYFVSINGANHMTFAGMNKQAGSTRFGQSLWEPPAPSASAAAAYGDENDHQALSQVVTILFWNAYLKNDLPAKIYLQKYGFDQVVGPRGIAEHK